MLKKKYLNNFCQFLLKLENRRYFCVRCAQASPPAKQDILKNRL